MVDESPQAFVYVIGSESGPQKIGVTSDATVRCATLQVATHLELKVFHSTPLPRAAAFAVERYAHKALAEYRLRGEWFDVSPAIAIEAVEAAARRWQDAVAGATFADNAGPLVSVPLTPGDVIDTLGGTKAVAELFGLPKQAVSNMRHHATLPARTFYVMQSALALKGIAAPPELWGMRPAAGAKTPAPEGAGAASDPLDGL